MRDEDLPSNEAVVTEIMGTYPTKGHTLYIDQLYSSPAVSIVLLRSVIGTLGLNMKNMPEDMKTHKLHKDETMALYVHKVVSKGDRVKKLVCLLSTVHYKVCVTNTGKKRGGTGECNCQT